MNPEIVHPGEEDSNALRAAAARREPRTMRTYTPSQAVLARSAGIFHWTPEGRRLFDFTSGVLVSNLGHNPRSWLQHLFNLMGWPSIISDSSGDRNAAPGDAHDWCEAVPLSAYNAVTSVEVHASRRLVELLRSRPGGQRMEQVLWAASGSEAIQKALWAALARDSTRDMIIATRHGFHGKKGLAGAVSGTAEDHDRDPRVRFISFPMTECADVSLRDWPFDVRPYQWELDALKKEFGRRLGVLITEPYLGSAGSFHPPVEYLHALQSFCRDNNIVFILDEVQANFGRTGNLFAFETYRLEPDIVVLGKGLGNGVPVSAAVGRADLFGALDFGEGSDTWSANPLSCAGVCATLEEFAAQDLLPHVHDVSAIIEAGLVRLKELPFIRHVRGEKGGMVWGLECRDFADRSAADWANAVILACYRGKNNQGIHLLGPLAKNVLRIAPPLIITQDEADKAMRLMYDLLADLLPKGSERLSDIQIARANF